MSKELWLDDDADLNDENGALYCWRQNRSMVNTWCNSGCVAMVRGGKNNLEVYCLALPVLGAQTLGVLCEQPIGTHTDAPKEDE